MSYSGISLGSIATYTTTEDYRVNGSRVFENQCEDGKWTPQAEIVHAGDSKEYYVSMHENCSAQLNPCSIILSLCHPCLVPF